MKPPTKFQKLHFNRILILFLPIFISYGCASGPCPKKEQKMSKEAAELLKSKTPVYERVKVYKPDGSLQCGQGRKISLDEMGKELVEIEIFQRFNKNDGMMRIQVCGAPTGDSNVYEIPKSELAKAISLGFKQWTTD